VASEALPQAAAFETRSVVVFPVTIYGGGGLSGARFPQ